MTTEETTADSEKPTPTAPPTDRRPVVAAAYDALVVAVWFVAAGVIGGLVWLVVASPPEVTRTSGSATVPSEELVKQVSVDGWFFVIALVGGLLSGVLLLVWRRRDPLLMVLLVTVGGGLASWLMLQVARALGPGDAIKELRPMPDGSHVLEQLKLHAPGIAWVWPIAAAFGALIYLWVLAKPDGDAEEPDNLR